jgi:hypothetical protein
MQKVLLILICLVLYCSVQAQVTTETTVKPINSKWEVGLDPLRIFVPDKDPLLRNADLYKAPRNAIFFRRNYGHHKAIRFRVGGEVDQFTLDQTVISAGLLDTFRMFRPYLAIGHEWQRQSGRLRFISAVDGSAAIWRENNYRLTSGSVGSQFPVHSLDTFNFAAFGIHGIIGIQYRFFSAFSIGIESSASVTYQDYWLHGKDVDFNGAPTGSYGGTVWKRTLLHFTPLSSIQLIYIIPKKNRHEKIH